MRFLLYIFAYLMSTEILYKAFLDSSGVTTDSRISSTGKMFFAIRGEKFDGHHFIKQALEKGCATAVIDDDRFAVPGSTIKVNNVLDSLQQLANYHRKKFNFPVLAITGSNGKTTTKELIREVLATGYNVLATRGNLNNHIGVPLTLLELEGSHQAAVIEMGANHIGEIGNLCNITLPDYGIITNIGNAHLEGFGSYQGVRKAKSELYHYLKKTHGKAFLNSLRQNLIELSEEIGFDYVSFGMREDDYIRGKLLDSEEELVLEITHRESGKQFNLKTRMTGTYNFENILAAVCTGYFFGIHPENIKEAIENYVPANLRSQIVHTGNNKLLLDAYNANPDSMKAAIADFFSMPGKNKSLILGDMLELGHYAAEEHKKIISMLDDCDFREVMVVGELFSQIPEAQKFPGFKNVEQLSAWLKENPLSGRFILIKGSRGLQLEKCVPLL